MPKSLTHLYTHSKNIYINLSSFMKLLYISSFEVKKKYFKWLGVWQNKT